MNKNSSDSSKKKRDLWNPPYARKLSNSLDGIIGIDSNLRILIH